MPWTWELGFQPANDIGGAQIALVERLEIDGNAPAVESGVGAVSADEGGEAFDGGVREDHVGQLLLLFGHGLGADGGRSLRNSLDDAGVLLGERSPWG